MTRSCSVLKFARTKGQLDPDQENFLNFNAHHLAVPDGILAIIAHRF